MKIICQRQKSDGSYHEIGTTHQTVFSHYKTVAGAVKGATRWANGAPFRVLVFMDDNIYRETNWVLRFDEHGKQIHYRSGRKERQHPRTKIGDGESERVTIRPNRGLRPRGKAITTTKGEDQ